MQVEYVSVMAITALRKEHGYNGVMTASRELAMKMHSSLPV